MAGFRTDADSLLLSRVFRGALLFLIPATLVVLPGFGCALFATRPVQEMSDTTAALHAAREVQADTLAPELYRQANEMFYRAKREYRYKNFKLAEEYAEKARGFAEQSEFDAIRKGGIRSEILPDPEQAAAAAGSAPAPTSKPYDYPTPTGTPADDYEKRKEADDHKIEQETSSDKRQPASNNLLIR